MKRLLMVKLFCPVLCTLACRPDAGTEAPSPASADLFTMHVPAGDAIAGRQAFMDMRCHACHRVDGEGFPDPVATPDVPVILGGAQARQSRVEFLESIMAPSCRIATNLPDSRSGTLSRMGDYSDVMTVRQLLDLVAYIQSLPGEQVPVEAQRTG